TASIANAVDGVVVVGAPDLPIGWTGKSWACWNGVAAAQRLLGSTRLSGFGGDDFNATGPANCTLRSPGRMVTDS
ncbi:MAG: hypothetical protein WBJ65_00160, partial [Candidatus Microthrix parvicella]